MEKATGICFLADYRFMKNGVKFIKMRCNDLKQICGMLFYKGFEHDTKIGLVITVSAYIVDLI